MDNFRRRITGKHETVYTVPDIYVPVLSAGETYVATIYWNEILIDGTSYDYSSNPSFIRSSEIYIPPTGYGLNKDGTVTYDAPSYGKQYFTVTFTHSSKVSEYNSGSQGQYYEDGYLTLYTSTGDSFRVLFYSEYNYRVADEYRTDLVTWGTTTIDALPYQYTTYYYRNATITHKYTNHRVYKNGYHYEYGLLKSELLSLGDFNFNKTSITSSDWNWMKTQMKNNNTSPTVYIPGSLVSNHSNLEVNKYLIGTGPNSGMDIYGVTLMRAPVQIENVDGLGLLGVNLGTSTLGISGAVVSGMAVYSYNSSSDSVVYERAY